MSCHPNFDPYGLALENYDGIGRYRMVDEKGRPIDAAVALPPLAGGQMVNGAIEMGQALASGGAFANCIAKNLVNFALAETPSMPVETNACAIRKVSDAFTPSSDGTFSSLVRGVAIHKLWLRGPGGAPMNRTDLRAARFCAALARARWACARCCAAWNRWRREWRRLRVS